MCLFVDNRKNITRLQTHLSFSDISLLFNLFSNLFCFFVLYNTVLVLWSSVITVVVGVSCLLTTRCPPTYHDRFMMTAASTIARRFCCSHTHTGTHARARAYWPRPFVNNSSPPVDWRRLVPPELFRRKLVLTGGRGNNGHNVTVRLLIRKN